MTQRVLWIARDHSKGVEKNGNQKNWHISSERGGKSDELMEAQR